MIVLCHILHFYTFLPGHAIIPEFLNAGVHLFLFISGYLYGGKIIKNFPKWYQKRLVTVALPSILISIFTIIALFIAGETVSVPSIIAYLLDAEGLLFLNWNFFNHFFSEILSLGPLWFTTVIMLCYLLVPVLQRISGKLQKIHFFTFWLIFLGAIITVLLINYFSVIYFVLFAVGYCLGKINILDKISTKIFLLYTGLFLIASFGRFILQRFFDNTTLYMAFVPFSRCIIGTWFVVFFAYINNRNHTFLSKLASTNAVQIFDKYSFYVFLAHGPLCMGFFNVYQLKSLPLATLLFFAGTIAIAYGLKHLSDFIRKCICL